MAVNKVVINQDGVENVLVDITDSTVTPNDMPEGVVAYDKSGEKITGSMKCMNDEVNYGGTPYVEEVDGVKRLIIQPNFAERKYVEPEHTIKCSARLSDLGNATPEDVAINKMFSSAEGVFIQGNLNYLGGLELNAPDAFWTEIEGEKYLLLQANSQEKGILGVGDYVSLLHPLSTFGDAKPSDVMRGKMFTSAEGFRIYGEGGKSYVEFDTPAAISLGNGVGAVSATVTDDDGLMLIKNGTIWLKFPLNTLGDATPEDVVAGKMFSSAAGILHTGTLEVGPGSIEVTDDGNGNLTILNAVVTDNNGDINVTM